MTSKSNQQDLTMHSHQMKVTIFNTTHTNKQSKSNQVTEHHAKQNNIIHIKERQGLLC